MNNSAPHKNHRQRARNAFRRSDPGAVPDRALLEMLLFYSVPRKDTNPIADVLLEKYGSISEILSAPYEELMQVEGMGESSALLFGLIPELLRRTEKPVEYVPRDFASVTSEIINSLSGKTVEAFLIICFDALGKMTGREIIAEGSCSRVTVDKRKIAESVFKYNADSVIVAHNHPGGEAAPSKEDIELTKELLSFLAEMEVRLSDHYIVGANDIISLASTPKFSKLFI